MARSKRRWVWVSRGEGSIDYVSVHPLVRKPEHIIGYCGERYFGSRDQINLCGKWFERITDIKLEPGELCKVEFTAKKVK